MAAQISHFIHIEKIPLIACQKYTDRLPLLGHFRVIIGIENNEVILHDPCPDTGGQNLIWPIKKLREHWKRTGNNVTGGVAIWISKEMVESPLGLNLPNDWNSLN